MGGYIELQGKKAIIRTNADATVATVTLSERQAELLRLVAKTYPREISITSDCSKVFPTPKGSAVRTFLSQLKERFSKPEVTRVIKVPFLHKDDDCIWCEIRVKIEDDMGDHTPIVGFYDGTYDVYYLLPDTLGHGRMQIRGEKIVLVQPVTEGILHTCQNLSDKAMSLHSSPVSKEGYRIFTGFLNIMHSSIDVVLAEEGIPENRKYMTFWRYGSGRPHAISMLMPTLSTVHKLGPSDIEPQIEFLAAISTECFGRRTDLDNDIKRILQSTGPYCIKVKDQELYRILKEKLPSKDQ